MFKFKFQDSSFSPGFTPLPAVSFLIGPIIPVTMLMVHNPPP